MNNKITKGNTAKLPGMRLFDEAWQPVFEKRSQAANELPEDYRYLPSSEDLKKLL